MFYLLLELNTLNISRTIIIFLSNLTWWFLDWPFSLFRVHSWNVRCFIFWRGVSCIGFRSGLVSILCFFVSLTFELIRSRPIGGSGMRLILLDCGKGLRGVRSFCCLLLRFLGLCVGRMSLGMRSLRLLLSRRWRGPLLLWSRSFDLRLEDQEQKRLLLEPFLSTNRLWVLDFWEERVFFWGSRFQEGNIPWLLSQLGRRLGRELQSQLQVRCWLLKEEMLQDRRRQRLMRYSSLFRRRAQFLFEILLRCSWRHSVPW